MKTIGFLLFLLTQFCWAYETKTCGEYTIHFANSSDELATIMGKIDFIDLEYMTKFDDGEKIKKGSIVIITSDLHTPQIIKGHKISDTKYAYQFPTGIKVSLDLNSKRWRNRNIASFKMCKR